VPSDAELDISGLNVSYGSARKREHVLEDVSITLAEGEVLGLVGESGSGKSTLLASVLGLLPPSGRVDSGDIRFRGRSLTGLSDGDRRELRRGPLRLVPQRAMSSLDPIRTVLKQLQQITVAAGRPRPTEQTIVDQLARVGLSLSSGQLRRYPHEFSGGQLQRMLIAASVLLTEPSVVLADEPTSTLDATVKAQVLDVLSALRSETGVAILFVSHDLGVVAQLCDRVAVLYAGEIVEQGEVSAIFGSPAHPYTQALLGSLADRHRRGERLAVIPGRLSDSRAVRLGCIYAPRCTKVFELCREVAPAPRPAGSTSASCHLYGEPA
jgi:oligopeptide/dipeptide ABC transporter ATP-binding protein